MSGHRFFAAIYDRLMASTEDAGLRDMRADLVASASGRTLELGAGTGLNLGHYPPGVSELVLTEPDPHMARRLRSRLEAEPPAAGSSEVVEAGAESLPFEDSSFDTVVSTLCLCTVAEPERVVEEVARVLRPGGRLLYIEHVRSDDTRVARWQDRLERPWGWLAAGCHPNRDTAATLSASGLEAAEQEQGELPKAPPIVKPLIRGEARLAQAP
ncbi:MAG TPA: class I SAM-dependent methyltransferase [Solirubrobacterales bacterium]